MSPRTYVDVRVKLLRDALSEAVRVGDTDAVKLLTKTLAEILTTPTTPRNLH
jgi:hypothetical protein